MWLFIYKNFFFLGPWDFGKWSRLRDESFIVNEYNIIIGADTGVSYWSVIGVIAAMHVCFRNRTFNIAKLMTPRPPRLLRKPIAVPSINQTTARQLVLHERWFNFKENPHRKKQGPLCFTNLD